MIGIILSSVDYDYEAGWVYIFTGGSFILYICSVLVIEVFVANTHIYQPLVSQSKLAIESISNSHIYEEFLFSSFGRMAL